MNNKRPLKYIIASIAIFSAIVTIFPYLIIRTSLFFIAPFPWYDKILAFFLLLAEFFSMFHAIGYFINLFYVLVSKKTATVRYFEDIVPETFPPVAILVTSFKEPLDILEETLICFYNLTYPNKQLYFLDDTRYDVEWASPDKRQAYRQAIDNLCRGLEINLFRRKWRGAKAGMINDFVNFLEDKDVEGFEFTPYSKNEKDQKAKYFIVFDADMNPFPGFVEPLVARIEKNPKLAFIQTPQFYSNFETNRLARGSGIQQSIFYEYICEGKSIKNSMFCCGTNFIMRREAIVSIGGFDETTVTEDVATSLDLHLKGWETAYFNKVSAFGMGPEDLGGYFKQQYRWALGTCGLLKKIATQFFKNPFKLPAIVWWEYLLTSTHYFIGWVYFIMVMSPILYLFFEVPSYFAQPEIYLLFFAPFFALSLGLFLWSLHDKRYRYKDLILGTVLNMLCFSVYMKATLLALIGVRGKFSITPKGSSLSLPLIQLWPQVGLALLCFTAAIWGIQRLIFEMQPIYGLAVNIFWVLFHCLLLSTIIYYNQPNEKI